MKKSVSLIGMPACGKSTVAPLLAGNLDLKVVEIDLLIQQKFCLLLKELIEKYGIDGFKAIESDVIKNIHGESLCISTGGSAIYLPRAMIHLKNISKIVFLDTSYETITQRIGDIDKRGVVYKKGQSLKSLFDERQLLCRHYADISVKTEDKTATQIAAEIGDRVL